MAREVLHVSNVFDGGISRAVSKIVELTPEIDHHLIALGGEVSDYSHNFVSVAHLPKGHLAAIREIRKRAEDIQPDIIHAHSSWAGMYCRVLGTKAITIYQPHCYVVDDKNRPLVERSLYALAENALSLRRQRVVNLTPHEEAITRRSIGSRLGRVRVESLPNAPVVTPAESEQALFTTGEDAKVAMVGRICRQKDPDHFLEVVKQLRARGFKGAALWVGDGDPEMRARLQRCGVVVTGWLNGSDLRALLSTVTVYIHTASYEGFPLSVLDAASFGIPVVARRIDCFENTSIPTFDSAAEMATAVVRMTNDEEEWLSHVSISRALVSVMNKESQRSALDQIYSLQRESVTPVR